MKKIYSWAIQKFKASFRKKNWNLIFIMKRNKVDFQIWIKNENEIIASEWKFIFSYFMKDNQIWRVLTLINITNFRPKWN
jgi:hypothetical protein